ncbi:MAG: hypothetical protein AAGI30_03835 [Planctomycetota bacterium]
MPKRSPLHISALEHLVAQQRYTPPRTIAHQIERIEALAADLRPGDLVDERTIVRRVTGFDASIEAPAHIPAEVLLADLSALAERLSEAASLQAVHVTRPVITAEALAEQWGVARRTLDRWRRRGLVGFRVCGPGGRRRLVFAERAARAFAAREPALLTRARTMRRHPATAHAHLADQAASLASQDHIGVSRAASRLACSLGMSPATARRSLRRADLTRRERGEPTTFVTPHRLSQRDRRLVDRALARGVRTTRLAERLGVSPATIHRVGLERRLDRLHRLRLVAPDDLDQHAVDAALDPPSTRTRLACWPEPIEIDPHEFTKAAARASPTPMQTERAMLVARGALVARAGWLIGAMPRSTPPVAELDRAETDLRWAAMLGWTLLRQQLPVIARAIVQHETPLSHTTIRVALEAAWSAVNTDAAPERRGRLAAPVGIALTRALSRPMLRPTSSSPLWLGAGFLFPPTGQVSALARLDARDHPVLNARFGLRGEHPRTAADLAETGQTSTRAVAEAERRLRRARREVA